MEYVLCVCLMGNLVRSHIIPKFMYKGMKAKEGKFYRMSDNPKRQYRHLQDGIKEYMLCADCDNRRLQPFETYLHGFLYGGIQIQAAKDGDILRVKGLDYEKLKLALLSILWRMSKASDPYFCQVNLGEKHETKLRELIMTENPGDTLDYPIMAAAPVFDRQFMGDWTLTVST